MIAGDEVTMWEHRAVMETNLWSALCCVFQLGDPRGLHHHTPAACCQGETVYREYRSAGTGGQRAWQGNTSILLTISNQHRTLRSQHKHGNKNLFCRKTASLDENIITYTSTCLISIILFCACEYIHPFRCSSGISYFWSEAVDKTLSEWVSYSKKENILNIKFCRELSLSECALSEFLFVYE